VTALLGRSKMPTIILSFQEGSQTANEGGQTWGISWGITPSVAQSASRRRSRANPGQPIEKIRKPPALRPENPIFLLT